MNYFKKNLFIVVVLLSSSNVLFGFGLRKPTEKQLAIFRLDEEIRDLNENLDTANYVVKSIGKKPNFSDYLRFLNYINLAQRDGLKLTMLNIKKLALQNDYSESNPQIIMTKKDVDKLILAKMKDVVSSEEYSSLKKNYYRDLNLKDLNLLVKESLLLLKKHVDDKFVVFLDKLIDRLPLNKSILQQFKQEFLDAQKVDVANSNSNSSNTGLQTQQEPKILQNPFGELYDRLIDTPEFQEVKDWPYKKYQKLFKD